MTSQYFESIQLIERLHRYFLDVVKNRAGSLREFKTLTTFRL